MLGHHLVNLVQLHRKRRVGLAGLGQVLVGQRWVNGCHVSAHQHKLLELCKGLGWHLQLDTRSVSVLVNDQLAQSLFKIRQPVHNLRVQLVDLGIPYQTRLCLAQRKGQIALNHERLKADGRSVKRNLQVSPLLFVE